MKSAVVDISQVVKWPDDLKKVGKDLINPANWQIEYVGPNADQITLGKKKVG